MRSSRPAGLVREVSRLRRPSLPTRSSLCAFCAARRYYSGTTSSTPPHHQHTSLLAVRPIRSFSTSQRARTLGTTAAEASSSVDDPSVLTTTPPTTTSTTTDTTTSTTSSTTPSSSPSLDPNKPLLPYTFQTGFSFFAKRASRPFPPPFISPPTSSFSEPLSTHHLSRLRRRRPGYKQNEKEAEHEDLTGISSGGLLRGYTNGDDALLATPRYLAVADGVGAWNTKPHGNAALWSRLMLHYFSIAADRYYTRLRRFIESGGDPFNNSSNNGSSNAPVANPVTFLQEAYTATMRATTSSSGTSWLGTTTACVAVLFPPRKLLVANLGDSQCRVLRPREHSFILKTEEQWHWFDCPRQLGTNSPDTPETNAVLSSCELEDDDIVILATDGLPDNLWEHEIVTSCLKSLGLPLPEEWGAEDSEEEVRGKGNDEGVSVAFKEEDDDDGEEGSGGPGREWERSDGEEKRIETDPMTRVASDLVRAAKVIATDPYAESPWMERAIDEAHLAVQGGKPDDISVVAARLRQAKY